MRGVTLLCLVAVVAAAVAAGVGAASGTLHVSPASIGRGGTVTFYGRGCREGQTVTMISKLFPGHAFGGAGAITTKAPPDETFRVRFTVPRSTRTGVYGITVRCGGGNLGVVAHLRVLATSNTLRVAPTSIRRGGTVTVTGGVCIKGDTVFLISTLFPGHAYGAGAITTTARANGHFVRTFRVPPATTTGYYTVTARCGGGNLGVVAHLRVS